MARNVFERFSQDRLVVAFDGAEAGTAPLTWGQKSIWQDMRDSGNQFSMGGRLDLPEGSTVEDAAARVTGLIVRHAALRMRLGYDGAGRPCQDVAGSGRIDVEILTIPDKADRAYVATYAAELMDAWPHARFDFERDWPLRMAVIRHRGACAGLVWVLSHLVADGGAHLLFLDDLIRNTGRDPRHPDTLDVARGEQEPSLRQLSTRTMRHWESQLRYHPACTFGEPSGPAGEAAQRYQQVRLSSPAAHLAMLAIARRTGTDIARVTLAAIAIAIARVTGVNPLTIKVMVNNRFRSGLADVIASIAQNSVLTIDAGDTSVDDVVARARGAALTAGMRAYYDPDELGEVMARLDAERGYPAAVTCRVNDQRAMVLRADEESDAGEVTPDQIRQRSGETTLTWLGPRENVHEQANILIENRPGVLSLYLIWDQWSLTSPQAEAILRGVEEVAVEAAFDPAAPTRVSPRAQGKP
jgi:hypothetical protein